MKNYIVIDSQRFTGYVPPSGLHTEVMPLSSSSSALSRAAALLRNPENRVAVLLAEDFEQDFADRMLSGAAPRERFQIDPANLSREEIQQKLREFFSK